MTVPLVPPLSEWFQQHHWIKMLFLSYVFFFSFCLWLAHVFASNGKLLFQFCLSFTWQWRAGAPETANFWNWVPKCNLLKMQPSLQMWKLAKWKACESSDNANANASASQCIPLQPLQNYVKTLKACRKWRQSIEANLSVCSIIFEVNLQLNFFNLWLCSGQRYVSGNKTWTDSELPAWHAYYNGFWLFM